MAASELSPAFALHARRYGDTSLLVDLFGRESGRSACIAKGTLGSKRAAGRIQPFQPLLVSLRGRGDVQTLVAAEPAGPAVSLHGTQLYCGLYLNELLLKLTARADPNPPLFDDYAEALSSLSEETVADRALRIFEVSLLRHLGHGLVLDRDVEGETIDPEASYTYIPDRGPQRTSASAPYTGRLFDALREGAFDDPQIQREARVFMRAILDHHLDGRAIRSRDLFR